jgi:hypothetical protein
MDFVRKNYLNIIFLVGILINLYIFLSLNNIQKTEDSQSLKNHITSDCITTENNFEKEQFSSSSPNVVKEFFPCERSLRGEKGERGERGGSGNDGLDGLAGLKGANGEKGEKGDRGEKGDDGDTGPIGPSGPTGAIGPIGPSGPSGTTQLTYGSFYDTTIQSNPVANVVRTVKYNSVSESDGVSIEDGYKIKISKTGVYNIQFSIQVYKDDTGSDTIDFWFAKNDNNLPDTNTRLTLVDRYFYSVAAWNFVTSANAGDEFELRWASADTSASLYTSGPFTTPTRPRIPSVIMTVTQIK